MQSAIVDSLIEIPKEKWPWLLSLYQSPDAMTARVAIRNQIYNCERITDFPVRVFAPFGNPDDGLVMIWNLVEHVIEMSLFTQKSDPGVLIKAIRETRMIDWNKQFLFCAVIPAIQNPLKDLMIDMKLDTAVDQTFIAFAKRDLVQQFQYEYPNDVEMKQLEVKHAEEINSVWPHRYPGSVNYFRNMLKWKTGFGLVGKEKQDLRAWVFVSVRGDLHSLHVQEEHRRKGYAKIVVKSIGKMLLERQTDVFGCIVIRNEASKSLFTEMGFEFLFVGDWRFSNKIKKEVES